MCLFLPHNLHWNLESIFCHDVTPNTAQLLLNEIIDWEIDDTHHLLRHITTSPQREPQFLFELARQYDAIVKLAVKLHVKIQQILLSKKGSRDLDIKIYQPKSFIIYLDSYDFDTDADTNPTTTIPKSTPMPPKPLTVHETIQSWIDE